MGGSPMASNSSSGVPNLACTMSMVSPLTGRGNPEGIFAGALDIASINKVSALIEDSVSVRPVASNSLKSDFMISMVPLRLCAKNNGGFWTDTKYNT